MREKKDKRKIISTIGVLIMLLVLLVVLTNRKNTQTGTISPELVRAMNYAEFSEGDDTVEGTDNVKFSAFFLRDINGDGYAEKIKGTCKEIGKEDTLYMEINVQTEGFLKDAKIQIDGKNFYLQTTLPKDDELKDNYIGNNIKEMEFNQLANGTQKLLTGIVRSGDYSYSSSMASAIGNDTSKYSVEDNQIILTGTYVDEEGNETQITKTVNLTMDWYGTTKTSLYNTSQTYYTLDNIMDEENQIIKLNFSVTPQETNGKLNISKSYVEGVIPELSGYAPNEVSLVGSTANFTYDAETREFTIEKEATIDETGVITSGIGRSNTYSIQVIYPLQAYQELGTETVEIRIPVEAYYEGYNNPNTEFNNPYRSNIAKSTIIANFQKAQKQSTDFRITVGKYITDPTSRYIVSKQKPLKIYNGASESEKDDTYLVTWYGFVGTDASVDGMVMKETKTGETQENDQFIKTDSTTESMENVTKNVGIYFGNTTNLLGEDGWIKVYNDETDELLITFDKTNLNQYSSSNPYYYETPVKHIRIETSQTTNQNSLYVYNIKEIDDEYVTTNYTKEEFDNLQYIKSTLVGYLGGVFAEKDVAQAVYEAPYSIANISVSKNTISTQRTEENEKITIQARCNEYNNQVKWENGSFLVKLPTEIISAEINEVTINNSNVELTSYELIKKDEGKFIKINTKNTTPQTYTITIDANLTPDPRIATTTGTIELYASNDAGSDYYYKAEDIYDVNDNLNTQEKVNKTSTSISLVSPNSLLTNQTATKYDDKGSMVISPEIADIKPLYAVVDQEEEKTAEIGLQIKNNYTNTISDVVILGKIPFEGNTYVISGKDLGSNFTTKMTSDGIQVPEELQGKVTVYYSENETPSKEVSDAESGWKTADQVTNWDNIKTFLIDFNDFVIQRDNEYVFTYTVKIPNGLAYNQVAFSHHGVYFNLDTEEGKYKTQTEPNRLGFRIAEKYNLELSKYQAGKEKLVPGATYKITEEGQEEGKTAVTDNEGKLAVNNLYAEKTYTIQEIKVPSDYELNEEIIKFVGHVDDNGNLSIEKTEGTTREDISVEKNEGEDYKAIIKVEDEAKARLKIVKKEQGTDTLIKGVRYKITGTGLPESGRTITTNTNGEVSLKGLKINEEYTLQEVKAEGYYLASQIKFKIVNNEGTYELQITEGEVKESSITEEDSLPIGNLVLEDEKIPTYILEITKIKKTTEVNVEESEVTEESTTEATVEVLAGAKFELYKDNKQIGEYTTGEDGKIVINNLYQYVEGKDENATYTLKEVLAPEGYAKVKDITFKVQEVDGELQFQAEDDTERNYTSEGSTLKLQIEDSPSFKLIKKDEETQEILPNVKFAIYNVENGEQPAKNSKGEILGTKETINGKEYYTLTTDENGEITADLQEGLYKAVEVQAPDKYDISNQTYYFGIGASREGKKGLQAEWAEAIGGSNNDYINSVAATSDGGYIAGGYFQSSTIQVGDETLTKAGSTSYSDGMIIKYNAEREVEWAKSIGGSRDDTIYSVAGTSDGGYIAGGYFKSSTIQVENETLTNTGSTSYTDGMIIKYNAEGEVEWARSIGGSKGEYIFTVAETSDGGIVAGGYFESSSINLENGVILNTNGNYDGIIIKYSCTGELEWAKGIGGASAEEIYSISETSDGGYIVGGHFNSNSVDLGNGIILSNYMEGSADVMIIKYSNAGEVEWAKGIGGNYHDNLRTVVETSDGGYMVGGYFSSSIDLGNDISLSSNGSVDGMLIKYNAGGEIEWAKVIGGSSSDYINSVEETSDGGYVVGGYFGSSIDLGNGVFLSSNGSYDGMIIKYNAEGEVEWAKVIGGSSSDYINSVEETSDGGYVVGGYFGSSIDLGNGVFLSINGSYDGMIIKLNTIEVPEIVVKQAKGIGGSVSDYINSVAETSDGGYIVGGSFDSSSIDLGNGVSLISNNGNSNGMVIKYNAGGEVEWARNIGGGLDDEIKSVSETNDGGYIVGGDFHSNSIDLGNGVSLSRNGGSGTSDGMIIKYNEVGEVEWAKVIGGSYWENINCVKETSDGGYIVGGCYSSSSIDLGNGVFLSSNGSYDGMIIKYNAEGEVEWAKVIGGSSSDYINSVSETSDGGYIVGGYFYSSSIDLGNGVSLSTNGRYAGMVIKYNAEGEVEWAKGIGGSKDDEIKSVSETNGGGYIVGGDFHSNSIDLGNGVTLSNKGTYSCDGMIIKYNEGGEVEWAKGIGGISSENINCVKETSDGGYIVGGYFWSSSINLGNGVCISNNGSTSKSDGMLIKYNEGGEVEWAKGIGGSSADYITAVAETSNGDYISGGFFSSSSIDLGNDVSLSNNGTETYTDGMLIKIAEEMGVPDVQEITVENSRKEFKITTDIKEIDGIKGGSISGEDIKTYETVKYGDSNIKVIKMTPDEDYEIIAITVNGEEYKFEEAEDGTYSMPTFTNMTEDKHIVVTYSLKDNKITINKVDEETKEPLSGAKFKLDQIEERTEPEGVIGSLTANGTEYINADTSNEIEGALGELTDNGTYYFVEENGTYVPTNSITYQTANGGTEGIQSSTANSYIPIDLSDKTGKYLVVVNAQVSSQSYDYGYATITETITAPSYSSSTGRFIYIYGTVTAKDYTSIVLEGGKTYYLHLGYYKNSSVDTGDDQIVFNSIKVYGTISSTYNFIENEGKYESNNQGVDSTVANSYIPIDLTNNTGKYNLVVNAEVSSQSYDYGYATVTETTTAPSYNTSSGRFVYISGTQSAQDYTTVLQGGKMYYLHLGYYKNASTSSGDDKFTVNSVQVTLNDSELYHTEVETNSDGQAITQIPFGKYSITEIQAPEGYELNETPTIIEFRAEQNHEFTIENQKQARIIVHHYEKETTTSLAEDEVTTGKIGERYTTAPQLNLQKYTLEVDSEGEYIIPENAAGTYEAGNSEVTYYYVQKSIPLTVHHYIEGTQNKVPLLDGSEAEDVTSQGKEGESYTTSAIQDSELSDEYELATIPENATGTYSGEEVIVTYYYKKVERNVVLTKYQEDGITPLEGAKFTISAKASLENTENVETTDSEQQEVYTTDAQGKIQTTLEAGEYTITEVEAPEGYVLPEDSTTGLTITRETEESQINVTNTKKQGSVIIHHYIEGTTDKVPLQDGTLAEDEVKTGAIGDIYITKEVDNLSNKYKLVELPENSSGNITEETIEITYYYRLKEGNVIVHHYKENTTESISADVTKTAKVDEEYTTEAATDIPANYELVEMPENATGIIAVEDTEVIYYYRLKTPSIETPEITKTSTIEKVTEVGQKVPYTITYTANVDQYIGDGVVTIVDQLPYAIDTEEGISSLDGGIYDETNKTITWTEDITEIDTFTNGKKQISITKNIEVTYKDLDVTQDKVTNTVTGKIELKTPEQENTVTTSKEIPTEFLVDIKVTKIWQDNETQAQKRPESIILVVKNGDTEIARQEINADNQEDEDTSKWLYSFTGLDKYDESGNEIIYTVDEIEKQENDLYFYTKTIGELIGTGDDKEITITNTFTKPEDKISIEVKKVWVDKNNIYGKRPVLLELQIKNKTTEEIVETKSITVKTEDSYTFTNLEKYDEDGNEIIYTADEKEVNEGDLYNYEKQVGTLEDIEGQTDKKQITITNTMVKVPGNLIVKYIDKSTQEEISDSVIKEGIVGESFDVSEDKKDIVGYTLIEEPSEMTGTYTEEEQIKTYYYAKNTKVIVKYLEKGTNKILTEEPQYERMGYEGLGYSTDIIEISGYTYVEDTGNTSGIIGRDTIEIIYYYAQNTKVTVKYLEKSTNTVLTEEPQYEIEGYEGKEYETEQKEISGYTFIESTSNTQGTMTKEEIEVVYYYAQNTKVIVKYLEKDTNTVLTEEPQYEIEGYEGKEYETEQKEISEYTFVENTNNTQGIMTKEEIEVIYYYAQNTKATVLHIDKETEEILKQETKEGKVGDIFETQAQDIEGYVLVQSPEEANVVMTKEEQIVKYYYAHISEGVIEKHIDDVTGEILYTEGHEGNEGDEYNIQSKTFEGYDLVESKLPENAQGKMIKDVIEVRYYYSKKASVRVEYIYKLTGEKLTEDVIINGHENDEYETEEKDFEKYSLEKTPENATGKMEVIKNADGSYNTETLVQYYYNKESAGVIEKHIDISNNEILAEEKHEGKVGDEYDISAREFESYELVEEDENGNNKLPTNSKGNMEEELIEVNYYYIKTIKVTVEYIDKQTGEMLDTYEIIGHKGDKYATEDKQFDGYDLEEIPTNRTGEIEDSAIEVKYYYNPKAEVEVKYLEKDTENALLENENISGHVGDEYKTEQKEIPYYKFVESTTNVEGSMTKEKITVIYYYQKQIFNLKVDGWISNVTMDGISQGGKTLETKDELYKIDIHRKKTTTTNVMITYKIRVSNIGEIEGSVDKLTEVIPSGCSFYQEDNTIHWENNNGVLSTTDLKDQTIKVGEYKELEITLRWNNGENNFGEKDNIVMLEKMSNPAGYQDTNKDDNESKVSMLIAIATGIDENSRMVVIAMMRIMIVFGIGILIFYKKREI